MNEFKSVLEYFEECNEIHGDWMDSEFFSPVSDAQIRDYEEKNRIKIPDSYKEWLRLSNGGYLFGRYVQLYGVNNTTIPDVGDKSPNGLLPEEYLVLGLFASKNICYDCKSETFVFFDYSVSSVEFKNFNAVLDYIIDVCVD